MMEVEAIILGLGGQKILRVSIKNTRGGYHESDIPVGTAALSILETALSWLGKTVKLTVEGGEIEAYELVG